MFLNHSIAISNFSENHLDTVIRLSPNHRDQSFHQRPQNFVRQLRTGLEPGEQEKEVDPLASSDGDKQNWSGHLGLP